MLEFIIKVAIEINKKGINYPIWAECLGMNIFTIFTSDTLNVKLLY